MFRTVSEAKVPQPNVGKAAIEKELQRILSSEYFTRSERCQQFLAHVVRTSLTGRTEELKERTMGIELFQRDPAYDTGEDAIVRVKANEVRRRLAQFNANARPDQVVRIELPKGSYHPEFYWPKDGPTRQAEEPARSRFVYWVASGGVVLLLLIWSLFRLSAPKTALQQFWGPVFSSRAPDLLCLGHPVVYLLSSRVHGEYAARYGRALDQGPYTIKLEPNEVLGADVVPVPDQFVGIGDSAAAFRIGSRLQSMGKTSEMRIGNDVSFSDLRASPVVLIGGYSNKWTLQMSNQFRFEFTQNANDKRVVDRKEPRHSWSPPSISAGGKVVEDYAIVSRVFESQSGQVMISAAGITQYGSQAAGEFLSDERYFLQAVRGAPRNWQSMNMQVVLRAKVFGTGPGPPEVVATCFW